MSQKIHAVTGAFGYSGKYIKNLLVKNGLKVKTLTNKKIAPAERGDVEVHPYRFDDILELARSRAAQPAGVDERGILTSRGVAFAIEMAFEGLALPSFETWFSS